MEKKQQQKQQQKPRQGRVECARCPLLFLLLLLLVSQAQSFLLSSPSVSLPGARRGGGSEGSYRSVPTKHASRRAHVQFLEGKVVWVTGASGGLGEQLAKVAAEAPLAGLILSGRRAERLEEVKKECLATNPHLTSENVTVVTFELGDVSDGGPVRKGAARALEAYGRVDVLCNNAGVSTRASALATPPSVLQDVMNVNFYSPVVLAREVLPGMVERGQGLIVLTNSVQGKLGISNRTAYAASKHALCGYFDSLRAELASRGVRVTSVFPGYIKTSLSLNAVTADGTKHGQMDATTAAGEEPETVARQVWAGCSSGRDEMILAPLKVRVGVALRTLAPKLLFGMMAKRAAKEEKGGGVS